MDAVILDHNIDTSFITQLERRNEKIKFVRIDADLTESLKEDVSEEELKEAKESLTETFRKALGDEHLNVSVEKLKNADISSVITLSEEGRRMQDMMKMYGMAGMNPSMFGGDRTLVLNANHALVQYILNNKDSEHVPMFCEQLYDLAMLSNCPLEPDAMQIRCPQQPDYDAFSKIRDCTRITKGTIPGISPPGWFLPFYYLSCLFL